MLHNAKLLRKNMTDAERILWQQLRAKRFTGFKFKRQQPLGRYIVDFVCLEAKLVIELDGGQHQDAVKKDTMRDAWLKAEGYSVLRFWNNEFLQNQTGCLEKVLAELNAVTLSLNPSGRTTKPLTKLTNYISQVIANPLKGEGS